MSRMINMNTIGDALLHAGDTSFGLKVEAVVVCGSSPMAVAPGSCKVTMGFVREDLFIVMLEHFQTDTANYADILLSAITQLEHVDVHKAYGHVYALANNATIAPMGQLLPNTEIFHRIARHMGFDDTCFANSDDDIASQAVRRDNPAAAHIDWATLKREGWRKLAHPAAPLAHNSYRTPSGRYEFHSEQMANDGLDPLPGYVPPHESVISTPELAKRYPLSMISPPAHSFLNSTSVNVNSLRSTKGEPHLDIHPDGANTRDVVDGELVCISDGRGAMQTRTHVTDRVRRGVAVGLSIWWKKFAPNGANASEPTSQCLTDMERVSTFYDCLIGVAPLTQAA